MDSPGSRPADPSNWWSSLAARSLRAPVDLTLALLDTILVAAAFALMLVLRYEITVPGHAWPRFWQFLAAAVVLQLLVNRLAGLYGPVWQHASIIEAQRILVAGGVATTVLLTWVLLGERLMPLSVVISGGLVATFFMGVLRFQARLFAFNRRQRTDSNRVLVVGAGHSGGALLREIDRDPDKRMVVAAMVDDDARKVGRSIGSCAIAGTVDDLVQVGRDHRIDQVILAIPTASSPLVRRVADAAAELGVPLKVLPSVAELMSSEPQLRDVRDLSIDDLLGRQPVATDLAAVEDMIRGRRVLVTGGGGSIGSEIVRQVAEYEPSCLLVLDRDETHLFDAMAAIGDAGVPLLMDVRDRSRVRELFDAQRPEIVFHAAANKHVPLLEAHPGEAAATNVLGTENVVTSARETGVERLVFVSTDKAVHPGNVMGASKRVGEQLVLGNAPAGSAWCAVRFGNVLGSRGSVVPTFLRQISEGGPVTLTHPEVTRFFMSIPEAVQLVLQAAALADDRQVFMLEMGQPVRIMDLANRMISLAGLRAGTDIEVRITGLRPGEKLTEELYTPEEHPDGTSHPKILKLQPPVAERDDLARLTHRIEGALDRHDEERVRALLLDNDDDLASIPAARASSVTLGPVPLPLPATNGIGHRPVQVNPGNGEVPPSDVVPADARPG